jgi:hypothetical protein
VKFGYKNEDEEKLGHVQKIGVQNDLDMLVSSCDSEAWPNFL